MTIRKRPIVVVIGGPIISGHQVLAKRLAESHSFDYVGREQLAAGTRKGIREVIDSPPEHINLFHDATLRFLLVPEMESGASDSSFVDGIHHIGIAGLSEDQVYWKIHNICRKHFEELTKAE